MSAGESPAEREGGVATLREVAALIWSQTSGFVRKRLILALSLVIVSSIAVAVAPVILKFIVDRLAATGDSSSVAHPASLIGLYVFSIWISRTLGAARGFFHAQADRRMYRSVSDQVFSHVMHLPLRFHLERQTGAINEILTNGLLGYQMVFQHTVHTLLPVIVELGTVILILMSLNQSEFLALFAAALACYGVAFTRGVISIRSAARTASSAQVEARAIMTDGLLNYETVKYFTAEPMLSERFEEAQQKTESSWMRLFRNRMFVDIAVGSIFAGFLAVTELYAAHRVQQGAMTVGDFVLVTTYVSQLVQPIELLGIASQRARTPNSSPAPGDTQGSGSPSRHKRKTWRAAKATSLAGKCSAGREAPLALLIAHADCIKAIDRFIRGDFAPAFSRTPNGRCMECMSAP